MTLVKPDPPSNSTVRHHQPVTVVFSYTTTAPGGVRVFVSPMVGLSRVADHSASTSKLLPTGGGTGEETFRVRSGSPAVDGIELRMTTDTQKDPLVRTRTCLKFASGASDAREFDDPSTSDSVSSRLLSQTSFRSSSR